MKIFIAYRFSGRDLGELRDTLSKVSQTLVEAGHETFIYFRDAQHWDEGMAPSKDIINGALEHLRLCDAILALQDDAQKSEGMLLEVGYAKALGKRMVLAVRKDVPAVFLRDLADVVIEYASHDELAESLRREV